MIESELPRDWMELQEKAEQILSEAGLEAHTNLDVPLARGTVSVDVLARDPSATPPTTYICECKLWRRAVPQNVVHAFRSVVIDSGAHRGFIISSGGFQAGAYEAAQHSNLDLVSWSEYQHLFLKRWFRTFMAPRLVEEGDALHQYTELFNSRIDRKLGKFPAGLQDRFRRLQKRYASASIVLLMLWHNRFKQELEVPTLPLRSSLGPRAALYIPPNILDAAALRPLMNGVSQFYQKATAEFDEIFGERA